MIARRTAFTVLALSLISSSSLATQCEERWSGGYASFDLRESVHAFLTYDLDGTTKLLAGAYSFDGESFSRLNPFGGFPLNSNLFPLNLDLMPSPPTQYPAPTFQSDDGAVVYDFGNGPGLAILGRETVRFLQGGVLTTIARFDQVNIGGGSGTLYAIAAHDDGSGLALYVGGVFAAVEGQLVQSLARFDGTQWTQVGAGLTGAVRALHIHDFGSGPELVAGGQMTASGGAPLGRVARWDGTQWHTVGAVPPEGPVRTLTTWNDGNADVLVAGGKFLTAGGQVVSSIAAFAGGTWNPLGAGISLTPFVESGVDSLIAEPGGTRLLAGGLFSAAGGVPAGSLAAWDGQVWTDYSQGIDGFGALDPRVYAMHSFDFGEGPESVAGGVFDVEGVPARYVARRAPTDDRWRRMGESQSLNARALAGTRWKDGSEETIVIAGEFTQIGETDIAGIARRNFDNSWELLGGGLYTSDPLVPATFMDMISFDGSLSGSSGDDSGVYVVGEFETAGGLGGAGTPTRNIARFDGTNWHSLGGGLEISPHAGYKQIELMIHDDGAGPKLYAVGDFAFVDGIGGGPEQPADGFAVWDGVSWTGITATGFISFEPRAMTVFDSGAGPEIHLAGCFHPQGQSRYVLARFDGVHLSQLGFSFPFNFSGCSPVGRVALESFDDGSGPKLWIGGNFPINTLACLTTWDGFTMAPVLMPNNVCVGRPYAFLKRRSPDGTRQLLYLDSSSLMLRSVSGESLAGFNSYAAAIFEGPSLLGEGDSLYAVGAFSVASTISSSRLIQSGGLAEFAKSCQPGEPFCFGDGGKSVSCTPCPCGNDAAHGVGTGCTNVTGLGARLEMTGLASASADTLRAEVRGMAPLTTGMLFSGDARLPANPANPCFGRDSGVANAGDGIRCIGGAQVPRHGVRPSDEAGAIGITTNGWGPPDGPSGGLIAFYGFVVGQTRHFQVFYRDAVTSGCGSGLNTTQGVSVIMKP